MFNFDYNLIPLYGVLYNRNPTVFSMEIQRILYFTILYIPFGFFYPLITDKKRIHFTTILIGINCIVFIELIQVLISLYLGFSYKSLNIDDIIFSMLGLLVGIILINFINRIWIIIRKKKVKEQMIN